MREPTAEVLFFKLLASGSAFAPFTVYWVVVLFWAQTCIGSLLCPTKLVARIYSPLVCTLGGDFFVANTFGGDITQGLDAAIIYFDAIIACANGQFKKLGRPRYQIAFFSFSFFPFLFNILKSLGTFGNSHPTKVGAQTSGSESNYRRLTRSSTNGVFTLVARIELASL